MQKFIARQPILDCFERVYGYELLFRAADEGFARMSSPSHASAAVISDSLFLYGLKELTGGSRAFINCSRETLVGGHASMLPRERVVLEVLETVTPDEEVMTACKGLKDAGYLLALDDFEDVGHEELVRLADIIKLDVLATSEFDRRKIMRKYAASKVKFLAEKVEKRDQFRLAVQQGYAYFQGYFFCKPEVLSARDIAPVKLVYFRLLQAVTREEINVRDVAETIKHDLSLSYKLLRFLNSALFMFRTPITTIQQALLMLGENGLRKWVGLIALSTLAEGRPPILVNTALVRAAFCEMIAPLLNVPKRAADYFFLGLLSNIDAILGRPMRAILAELPITEEVRAALMGESNQLHDVLETVLAYERANWASFSQMAQKLTLPEDGFSEMYMKSLRWCSELGLDQESAHVETPTR
jgi:EAL and modified HD-GYP domain-containing signal transduction protein